MQMALSMKSWAGAVVRKPGVRMWVLGLVAVAAGALIYLGMTWGASRDSTVYVTVEAMQNVAKVATVEVPVTVSFTQDSPLWGSQYSFEARLPKLFQRQFVVLGRGTLVVGVDLTQWDLQAHTDYNRSEKTVKVTVPAPQILYVTAPTSEVVVASGLFRGADLSTQEHTEINARVDKALRETDRLPDILTQAQAQFRQRLEEAFNPHGLKLQLSFQ